MNTINKDSETLSLAFITARRIIDFPQAGAQQQRLAFPALELFSFVRGSKLD